MTGVRTDAGDIEAEVVVNCAGQWAKALGDQVGVTVPLHSAEHFYVVTDQLEGVHADLPILRDPDGYIYVKEEVGGLVVGGFEPVAKPWVSPSEIPYPFEFQLLDEDWEHFSVLMDAALSGSRPWSRPASASSTTVRRASPRTTSSCSARRPDWRATSSGPASTRSASRRPAGRGERWPSGSSRVSRRWT